MRITKKVSSERSFSLLCRPGVHLVNNVEYCRLSHRRRGAGSQFAYYRDSHLIPTVAFIGCIRIDGEVAVINAVTSLRGVGERRRPNDEGDVREFQRITNSKVFNAAAAAAAFDATFARGSHERMKVRGFAWNRKTLWPRVRRGRRWSVEG